MTALSSWTDPILNRMKELAVDPFFSNAAIASALTKEFGVYFSRNSIIGKRAREGIKGLPRPSGKRSSERASPRRVRAFRPRAQTHQIAENGLLVTMELPTVFPHACALVDLTNESCRYPVGDVGGAGFFFCGAPGANLVERKPYCPAHAQIVWRRP